MPIRSLISSSASPARVETARQDAPHASSRRTLACSVVVPPPRSFGLSCSGLRVIRTRRPPMVASSSTSVRVPTGA